MVCPRSNSAEPRTYLFLPRHRYLPSRNDFSGFPASVPRTDVVASCAVFGFRSSSSPFQNDTGKPMQHLTSAFLSLGWVGCGREEPPCNVFDSIAVIIIMANSSIAETRRSVPTCPEYGPRQGRVPVSMINRSILVK